MIDDCRNLDAYLDDVLTPGERVRFAAHLDECPNCREAVDEQQWIDGLLRAPAAAERELPPPALFESCRAIVARGDRRRRLAVGWAAAAAAVVTAATLMLSRGADGPRVPQPATVVAMAEAQMPHASTTPSSTFIADSGLIVVPVVSRSANVTVVRVYTEYQPDLTADAGAVDASAPEELVRPEPFRGG